MKKTTLKRKQKKDIFTPVVIYDKIDLSKYSWAELQTRAGDTVWLSNLTGKPSMILRISEKQDWSDVKATYLVNAQGRAPYENESKDIVKVISYNTI